MKIGIAIGYGWVCGSLGTQWLDFPWTLAFALFTGIAFGVVSVLVERRDQWLTYGGLEDANSWWKKNRHDGLRSRTPDEFRDALIAIARSARTYEWRNFASSSRRRPHDYDGGRDESSVASQTHRAPTGVRGARASVRRSQGDTRAGGRTSTRTHRAVDRSAATPVATSVSLPKPLALRPEAERGL